MNIIRKHLKRFRFIQYWLVLSLFISPTGAGAKTIFQGAFRNTTPPPSGTVPVLLPGFVPSGASVDDPVTQAGAEYPILVKIRQDADSPKVTLKWASFNIGDQVNVHFDQANSSDVALNRIYDQSPSLIYGKLSATGRVFLVNQNGIVFGPGSEVNLNTLIASSLNISDSDFEKGLWRFQAENYLGKADYTLPGAVSNHGDILLDPLGGVYLVAPNVENAGTITAPIGQIGLAAGTDVEIAPDPFPNSTRGALVVNARAGAGTAENLAGGRLEAETGTIGMYGKVVRQEGLIRAVTAIRRKGQIELRASDRVETVAGSVIETPITESDEAVHESFDFAGGTIRIEGLDAANPVNPQIPVPTFDHHGTISAPAGTITVNAGQRIFLDTRSVIDVGGIWAQRSAADNIVSMQLNSVELRDDFFQKGGFLQGKTVYFHRIHGTAIGNAAAHLQSDVLTAQERAVSGGVINLTAGAGDIIIKSDALLDFSGGGYRYAGGTVETTQLFSQNVTFNIADAPSNIRYDRMALQGEYSQAYTEGADAGQLNLHGRRIVLDGRIDGSATQGIYQTAAAEPVNAHGFQKAKGWILPKGGDLYIGRPFTGSSPEIKNAIVEDILIEGALDPLPLSFKVDDDLPSLYDSGRTNANGDPLRLTRLSSDTLSNAGLGSLVIYANTGVSITPEARISLAPESRVSITARSILHQGTISVPAGSVALAVADNKTSFDQVFGQDNRDYHVEMAERILLDTGSVISVAGERVNNNQTNQAPSVRPAKLAGGSISALDNTVAGADIVMKAGAALDVSGGYELDARGGLDSGAAGSITLRARSLALDGRIEGFSFQGEEGGRLDLGAWNIRVANEHIALPESFEMADRLPEGLMNSLLLDPAMPAAGGFTKIALQSVFDATVSSGITLAPSFQKRGLDGQRRLTRLTVAPEEIGGSSIAITAGQDPPNMPTNENDLAVLTVEPFAAIVAAPGGSINLSAPAVRIDGALRAPAGTVAAKATQKDLVTGNGAVLYAGGFLKPDRSARLPGGLMGYTPMDAGSVSLSASTGTLKLSAGSIIDVSGTAAVSDLVFDAGRYQWVNHAGAAGSLSLVVSDTDAMVLDGTLNGKAFLNSVPGGVLSIQGTDAAKALMISGGQLQGWADSGFGAIRLASTSAVRFSGTAAIDLSQDFTIDAPRIEDALVGGTVAAEADASDITIRANSVHLTNTFWPGTVASQGGNARLSITGGQVDVEGGIVFSRFGQVSIAAEGDLTLADRLYRMEGRDPLWRGEVISSGDITLKARRIYPRQVFDELDPSKASPSTVRIQAGDILTVLPGISQAVDTPIHSAGGDLTLIAGGIDIKGYLAAPLGTITITATDRAYLDGGSRLSVAGAADVHYGKADEVFWYTFSKEDGSTDAPVTVDAAPEKAIHISGSEVIFRDGAEIDISGGGSLFAYAFYPSPEGSVNPFSAGGRKVVMPAGLAPVSGEALYLEGAGALPAGNYVVVPESFGFSPEAYIIEPVDMMPAPGRQIRTAEGYPVAAGYETIVGTGYRSAQSRGYAVRKASEVKSSEGYFVYREIDAGDAGKLVIDGAVSTVMQGNIIADAVPGFRPASLSLSGREITVALSGSEKLDNFDFDTPLSETYRNKLYLDAAAVGQMQLETLNLGNTASTTRISLAEGTRLRAEHVSLNAEGDILMNGDAAIMGIGDSATASLVTTGGSIHISALAQVTASGNISIDTGSLVMAGVLNAGGGLILSSKTLSLKSDRMTLLAAGADATAHTGSLILGSALWTTFGQYAGVTLTGREQLVFDGDATLSVSTTAIGFDTPWIVGRDATGDGKALVTIDAKSIGLKNSSLVTDAVGIGGQGSITLVGDTVELGHGNIGFDGFGLVEVNSDDIMAVRGEGAIHSGGGIKLTASKMITGFYQDENIASENAGYAFTAAAGNIEIAGTGVNSDTESIPGGRLHFEGTSITLDTHIETPSGQVVFLATGSGAGDGIFLGADADIIARGTDHFSGGSVSLTSTGGKISLAKGSMIDVSAGAQGDAGSLALSAVTLGVSIQGELHGNAEGVGRLGGSFFLETDSLDIVPGTGENRLGTVIQLLSGTQGGFDKDITIRTRSGDLSVPTGLAIEGRTVSLTADTGNIELSGRIDASGADGGGMVRLNAGGDWITLWSGSQIAANGLSDGVAGGDISLGVGKNGYIVLMRSTLNVSPGNGGEGGGIYLRAPRNAANDDVNVYFLGARIDGASRVTVEGVGAPITASTVTSGMQAMTDWKTSAEVFMGSLVTVGETTKTNRQVIVDRLAGGLLNDGGEVPIDVIPGLEIVNDGDIRLGDLNDAQLSSLDLSAWRFDGRAGAMTIRAGGNLTITDHLVDHPTIGIRKNAETTGSGSWAITLAAGADLTSTDPFAINYGVGDLELTNGVMVYSESAPIRLASGNDTIIGTASTTSYMVNTATRYNLGTFDGDITGRVGGDLEINGGVIQSALGDIDIDTKGNLYLNLDTGIKGSIRTTGAAAGTAYNDYWRYSGGGDIRLTIGGSVTGGVYEGGWDHNYKSRAPYEWAASYQNNKVTSGLATMGGGDLTVFTGGNFYTQAGTFGEGDLRIFARGDVDGRFLVKAGHDSSIESLGNFGSKPLLSNQAIEMFDARVGITALGNVSIGAVVNPTIARANFNGVFWNLTYTEASAIDIAAVTGSVTLHGDSRYYNNIGTAIQLESILPGTVSIFAGQDIRLLNEFAMAPAAEGNLTLNAGGTIDGIYTKPNDPQFYYALIAMSDLPPEAVYGAHRDFDTSRLFSGARDLESHADLPIHGASDTTEVRITAGEDIRNLFLTLPEPAVIRADRDIRNINYFGQNIRSGDVSILSAGRDISQNSPTNRTTAGITQNGPGALVVIAGNTIDLGNSEGIQLTGAAFNTALDSDGSELLLMAGYSSAPSIVDTEAFFNQVRKAGEDYSLLMASGNRAGAKQYIDQFRSDTVDDFFGETAKGAGDIDMITSQISSGAGGDIYVLNRGRYNVGRSTLPDSGEDDDDEKGTGIITASGGGINIFSIGDVNVNESRVMTFLGGDITIWSDQGSINAGRGARTAVSVDPPEPVPDDNGVLVLQFTPPAVGSGVRTLTYDPDGIEGPKTEPLAGDVYLFAPEGIIDAGEAGISGRRVVLGATAVLNAQNITFSAGSVGVPVGGDTAISLGALSGVGALSETKALADQTAVNQSGGKRLNDSESQLAESLMPSWLDVRVISFEEEEEEEEE
ncbi:MAG: filamentous hemagglutinin family protein [Pseudomonadota bacterium]